MASPGASRAGPRASLPPSEEADGRLRILDAAAALFLERGYLGTSLREIATSVGMKPGSLYYHFASKEALLEAILLRGIAVMVDAFERASRESAGRQPGRQRFAAHVRAHLAALFEHGPYTAAHVTTFRTAPPAVTEAIVPARDSYEAMWSGLLESLVVERELDPETPIGLSRLTLFGAMNSSVEWFDRERGNLDALAEVITQQFWSGFGRAPGEAGRGQGG